MVQALQVTAVLLVAVAMAFALAHLAELPGKLRLDEATYRRMQVVYYPGFTIGGAIGELGGIAMLIVLAVVMPHAGVAHRYVVAALMAMLAMHGVFWLLTQPINRTWMQDVPLARPAARFFGKGEIEGRTQLLAWTSARNIWECSHAVRAVLALVALVLALLAVTMPSTAA